MSEEKKSNQPTDSFAYSYSARRKAEVEAIRRKYAPKTEDKLETLRRLDRTVVKKGSSAAVVLGTVGCLVMGTGMSMTMVWTDTLLLPGILVGLAGMAGMASAYPLYTRIVRRERERIAPEVLQLADELLQ